MSDRLALAVGKVVLAWGRLDQQLHVLIRASERRLGLPHTTEGRFTERRKIFRRLCMKVAHSDQAYERKLDRELANLVKLEKKRGRIAHGFASPTADGAYFFDAPEAFKTLGQPEPELMMLENLLSFDQLDALEEEIDECAQRLTRLMLLAPQPSAPETH